MGEGSFLCLCFQRAVKALKISYPATGEEDDLVASDEWAWTDPEAAKKQSQHLTFVAKVAVYLPVVHSFSLCYTHL